MPAPILSVRVDSRRLQLLDGMARHLGVSRSRALRLLLDAGLASHGYDTALLDRTPVAAHHAQRRDVELDRLNALR